MNPMKRGVILIFEDEKIEFFKDGLKKIFGNPENGPAVWVSDKGDRKPVRNLHNDELKYLNSGDLKEADAIIVDLKMPILADKKFDFGPFGGINVLRMAEKAQCLDRTFISSAVLNKLNRELKDELSRYLEKGLRIYDKNDTQDLFLRIFSELNLKHKGFHVDFETAEKLLLVGRRLATGNDNMLILGKTGTGKESAARHIADIALRVHRDKQHGIGSLQVIHCGGLSKELARNELFGHVKGSYSGALEHTIGIVLSAIGCRSKAGSSKAGYREWLFDSNSDILEKDKENPLDIRVKKNAPYGIVFLDEFAELHPEVQALLLRTIEKGEVVPLGYEGIIHLRDQSDCMHIAFIGATNDPQLVKLFVHHEPSENEKFESSSRLREDLAYRIAIWVIEMPDLKPEEARALISIEKDLMEEKEGHKWEWTLEVVKKLEDMIRNSRFPGQRRELRTVIRRSMAYAEARKGLGKGIPNDSHAFQVRLTDIENAGQLILIESRQPEKSNFQALRQEIANMLKDKKVWTDCPDDFEWDSIIKKYKVKYQNKEEAKKELTISFLKTAELIQQMDGQPEFKISKIEEAWGVKKGENSTIRNYLKEYLTEAFFQVLEDLNKKVEGITKKEINWETAFNIIRKAVAENTSR
jgi:DNA-binding NtrC family response regulator